MRFREKRLRGSFTIEASILVPLTFFLIAAVIHLLFFLYGRCLLTQDTYLLALRASLLPDVSEAVSYVEKASAAQMGRKYFGNERAVVSASVTGEDVFVQTKSVTKRSGYDLVTDDFWQAESVMRARHYNLPAHIRRIDRIADIISMGLERVTERTEGE